jgi:hypothetical protein
VRRPGATRAGAKPKDAPAGAASGLAELPRRQAQVCTALILLMYTNN